MKHLALIKLGIVPMFFEAMMKEARTPEQVLTDLVEFLDNLKENKIYLLHHFGMDAACLKHCLSKTGHSLPQKVKILDMRYLCQQLVSQLADKHITNCKIASIHKHIKDSYYHNRECQAKDHDSETDVVKELECYAYLMKQNKYVFSEDSFVDFVNKSLTKQPAEGRKRKKEVSEEDQNEEEEVKKLIIQSGIELKGKKGKLVVDDLNEFIKRNSSLTVKKGQDRATKLHAIWAAFIAPSKRCKLSEKDVPPKHTTSHLDTLGVTETASMEVAPAQKQTTSNLDTLVVPKTTQAEQSKKGKDRM